MPSFHVKVFLVDDGSTDDTRGFVKSNFPEVNVIDGTGDLYWNQGMRLAWGEALRSSNYDFFLWLNDDTELYETTFEELFETYNEAKKNKNRDSIVVGACEETRGSNLYSYGGKFDDKFICPNGKIQQVNLIHGNVVLVPNTICSSIGILDPKLLHNYGDRDYGLRAIENDYSIFTTKCFVACCERNKRINKCFDKHTPIRERVKDAFSPLSLDLKHYYIYLSNHNNSINSIFSVMKALARIISPSLYSKLKRIHE
jgi:GT2 family glycosyltransferase